MEESSASFSHLAAASKNCARRLLTIGENRLELLAVELQEERERLLLALLLALGVATFALLCGLALTAVFVVWLWPYTHVIPLVTLTVLYGAGAIWLCRRLRLLLRDWESLPATLDQLQKDRASLEKVLA